MKRGKIALMMFLAMLLLGATSAFAGTVLVGLGAFSSGPDITFESLTTYGTPITNQYTAYGVTFGNLWADNTYGTQFFADAGLVGASNFAGPGGCCVIPATMSFSMLYGLVGFEIVSNGITQFTVTGGDSGVDVFNVDARPCGNCGIFIGFQNAASISSISIGPSAANNAFLLDNIRLEGTTPEPNSLFLLGTGLVGALGVIRRKINL